MPSGYINTSLLLNGDVSRGLAFWDRDVLQVPTGGEYSTYSSNNSGFTSYWFNIQDGAIEMHSGWPRIMQRVLLSPGSNSVHYCMSARTDVTTWSVPRGYTTKLDSVGYSMGVWKAPTSQFDTRIYEVTVDAKSEKYTWDEVTALLQDEIYDIASLHMNTIEDTYDAPLNVYTGFDPAGSGVQGHILRYYYTDYRNISTMASYTYGGGAVPEQAWLYLRLYQKGFTEYYDMAYKYAWGLLNSVAVSGFYFYPMRYDFSTETWTTYQVIGEPIPFDEILNYLSEVADTFKNLIFFQAARLFAVQMYHYNWWTYNSDPEGLYFISHSMTQSGTTLTGDHIERQDTGTAAGASVSSWNHDHELMRGSVALSKFLSVVRTNPEIVGSSSSFLAYLGCSEILYDTMLVNSLTSIKTYADEYDQKWSYGSEGSESALTEDWWWRYNRFSDFVGTNYDAMVRIALHRLSEGYSLNWLKSQSWYGGGVSQGLQKYLYDHHSHWEESNRLGGRVEQNAYNGWHCYYLMYNCDPTYVENWEQTFWDTLWSSIKGSFCPPVSLNDPDYQKNAIGLLGYGDWEPRKNTSNPALMPGDLFSWIAETIEMTAEPDQLEVGNLISFAGTYLNIIKDWHKGDAGYPYDTLVRSTWNKQGEGELYLYRGLLNLYYFLNNYDYVSGFTGTFNQRQ